jgi:hypothetical protein
MTITITVMIKPCNPTCNRGRERILRGLKPTMVQACDQHVPSQGSYNIT